MQPRPFRLSDEVLDQLAAGGGGKQAAKPLISAEQSRRRMTMVVMLELAAKLRHPHSKAAEHAYGILADAQRKQPGAMVSAFDRPAVGAWLQATARELIAADARHEETPRQAPDEPDAAAPAATPEAASAKLAIAPPEGVRPWTSGPYSPGPAQLGAIAAVAALKAGLSCRVEVPAPDGVITLPSLGQIVLPPASAGGHDGDLVELRVHPDGLVECEGVRLRPNGSELPHWRRIHELRTRAGLVLLLDDLDPFRWPAETVIDGRLGEDEFRKWEADLSSAWDMLLANHWTIADETRLMVSVLTPIKGPEGGLDSASAADRFGTIAMSTPLDGCWLASTFAHEVQHAKLGAVLDVVHLLHPDSGRYYAPWRPDPRPLSGLLQGAYAYLGVSGFWRRQRQADQDVRAHAEFARWRRSAYDVTSTLLDSGRLTATGRRFVTRMRRTLEPWLDEPVPAEALAMAQREAEAHRAAWLARNTGADSALTG